MVNVFNILLSKLNENQYSVKFGGNVIFRFYTNTDTFDMVTVNEDTLTLDTEEYVPVFEQLSEQVAFVDKNKRHDWLKSYLFALRVEKREFDANNKFYKAMIETVEAMNGATVSSDNIKYAFKVNYPKKVNYFQHGKAWYIVFEMVVNLSSVEHGTFGNDYTVWIAEFV